MLAKHGPWSHHVRTRSPEAAAEAQEWLVNQGKKPVTDFEVLVEDIQHKNSKKVFVAPKTSSGRQRAPRLVGNLQPIIFFNEVSLATYVKLTWGGK